MMRMSFGGLLFRMALAMAFCYATYNGSIYHLVNIVIEPAMWSTHFYPTALVVALWSIIAFFLARVLWKLLDWGGVLALIVVVGLSLGWAYDSGVITLETGEDFAWVAPGAIGFILGCGLLGGFVYRWATGQLITSDPDT